MASTDRLGEEENSPAKRAEKRMRSRGSLSTSLLVILLILGAFAAIPALIAYSALGSASEARREQVRLEQMMSATNAIKDGVLLMQSNLRGFVISGRPHQLERWRQGRDLAISNVETAFARTPDEPEFQAAATEMRRSVNSYIDSYAQPLIDLALRDRDAAAARISRGAARPFAEQVRAKLNELVALFDAAATNDRRRADSYSARARTVLIVGIVGGLVAALLSWLFVLRTVRRPLLELTDVVDRFGHDDFKARAEPTGVREIDFLMRSFNEMASQREEARAQVMAASEAKSEFLARMSHELRTPLNAILGFGQLLEMDGLKGKEAESVDQILRAGRHLLGLIDEVLEISRIESGSLRISMEPVAMKGVVADVQSMVGPLAAERSIKIETSIDDESRYVYADQQRLKQILLNLLTNAIKYNRQGGKVKLVCSGDGETIRMAVSDTGAGIDPALRERLFTPFERLGAESRGEVPGTGLGLALSQKLAELMAGTLVLEESGAAGSTFVLSLPEAKAPASKSEAKPEQGEPVGRSPEDLVVVYIEDNVSNFNLVEQIFAKHLPARLYTSIQGSIGFELVRRHKPDLVLLDLHLPDVPGETLLAQLESDPETRDIPIVVVSADATTGHRRRLIERGAAEFLTKPIDVPKFLETVRRVTRLGEGVEIDAAN